MSRTETLELAVELYLVPPAGFVTARDELARQAQAAGDRELAAELRGLRRPKLSAWLVNLLVRHERVSMDRLTAVGRELREAQTQLDTHRLRQLAGERQQLIAELLDRGRHRAAEAGVRPSPAVLSEVEATLKAALVDLAASSMVLSGRLVKPMSHSGFGPMPWVAASAPPRLSASAPPGSAASTPPGVAASPSPDGVPEWEEDAAGEDGASVLDLFESDYPVLDELAQRRARAAAGPALAPVDDGNGSGVKPRPARFEDDNEPERAVGWPHQKPHEEQHAHPVSLTQAREVQAAAAALAKAEAKHWQREFELADAEGAVDAARDRCETLDTQRFQARRDRTTAERHLAEAQAAQQAAVRAVEAARRALEAAERPHPD